MKGRSPQDKGYLQDRQEDPVKWRAWRWHDSWKLKNTSVARPLQASAPLSFSDKSRLAEWPTQASAPHQAPAFPSLPKPSRLPRTDSLAQIYLTMSEHRQTLSPQLNCHSGQSVMMPQDDPHSIYKTSMSFPRISDSPAAYLFITILPPQSW